MAIGKVSQAGIMFEASWLTVAISGTPTQADLGKAVTWDVTAANTVKLAGDQDRIIGRLEVLESRTIEGVNVATVSRRFSDTFPILANETFAVGDTAVGGGSGTVRVRKVTGTATPDWSQNVVVEVRTDSTVVVQNF